jgi:hypothetical protein
MLDKGVDLLKRNINALKGDKPQDETVNWHYINHMAGEMESRLEEYKQIIPFMEESLSNMMVDTTPTSGGVNSAINHQGKVLVNLAERVASIRSDIHTLRWIRIPFR